MSWNSSYKPREGIIDIQFAESSPTEPLTLDEVKTHLKIDYEDRDDYLEFLQVACRKELEKYLGLSLVEKTVTLTTDVSPEFTLPYGPVQTISTVKRRSGSSNLGVPEYDTIAAADYNSNGDFLYTGEGRYQIVYEVGMTEVPEDIRLQLLRLIAYRNSNAGDEQQLSIDEIVGTANRNMSWI